MRFILGLTNWHENWELTKAAATKADGLGFWGLSMPDHYMRARMVGSGTLESWIALTYLASMTKTVHVGTMVTPIPLRPPALLAKMVATTDILSNGRSFLGVGAGWFQDEFVAYGEWNDPRIRASKTEEGLRLIQYLWTKETVDFKGKFYRAKNAVLEPKPVQKPHPPLLFGGSSPRMLILAGRWADIVFLPPDMKLKFDEAKKIILESAKAIRRKTRISFASGSPNTGPQEYDRARFEKNVLEAETNGCDYFDFSVPEAGLLESMKDFAVNIMPSFN